MTAAERTIKRALNRERNQVEQRLLESAAAVAPVLKRLTKVSR